MDRFLYFLEANISLNPFFCAEIPLSVSETNDGRWFFLFVISSVCHLAAGKKTFTNWCKRFCKHISTCSCIICRDRWIIQSANVMNQCELFTNKLVFVFITANKCQLRKPRKTEALSTTVRVSSLHSLFTRGSFAAPLLSTHHESQRSADRRLSWASLGRLPYNTDHLRLWFI